MGKKTNLVIAALASAVTAAGIAAGDRLYHRVVVPRSSREGIPDFSGEVARGRLFVRNHPGHQDVYLDAVDLLKLHASFIQAEEGENATHRYAVLVHGRHDYSESMGVYAERYLARGFSVLLPDLRGHGKSEGEYIGYGGDDSLDILSWVYWLIRRDPEARIVLHGVSMGAATVLMTAGEALPDAVRAVISDSAYTDLRGALEHTWRVDRRRYVSLPSLPFGLVYFLLRIATRIRAGYDMDEIVPSEAVVRARVPILFLHGSQDHMVPVTMATRLFEEAGGTSQGSPHRLVVFPGAEHVQAAVTHAGEYWAEVDRTLRETGLGPETAA